MHRLQKFRVEISRMSHLACWETLEEDQSEMCSPSAPQACPASHLSLLALSVPSSLSQISLTRA